MEFGVQKKQYHQFYRQITGPVTTDDEEELKKRPLPEAFLSLSGVSELDFISFARYWSDFQYVLLGMSMRYPELRLNGRKLVFFGDRSLDELAFRSYEIYLVNQYLSGHDLTIIDIGEGRCQWSEDCDVVLAALLLQLGFNNYRAITRHSAWLYLAGGEDSLNLAE